MDSPALRRSESPLDPWGADIVVTGGTLQTSLTEATTVRANWDGRRAAKLLLDGQFDQAPVLSGANLVGYALRSDLEANPERRVRSVMRPLNQDVVLSGITPLRTLLPVLHDRRFAFIVGTGGISGFVTPSDLNKHPARSHFYLLLAALEIGLAELLRHHGPPSADLISQLSVSARRTIERRYAEDREADVEVDYLVYFEFSQLVNLTGSLESTRRLLGFDDKPGWRSATSGLVRLRHAVMHPTREFLGPSRSVADLMHLEARIRDLLDRIDASVPPWAESEGRSPSVRGMTLHEAMRHVLEASGGSLLAREIAEAINVRGLYRRSDGARVGVRQIHARASNYPTLFARSAAGIHLANGSSVA